MAVTAAVTAELFALGPLGPNPEMPFAYWIGVGTITGDASGGTAIATITVPTSDDVPFASFEEASFNSPIADTVLYTMTYTKGLKNDSGSVPLAISQTLAAVIGGLQRSYSQGLRLIHRATSVGQPNLQVQGSNPGLGNTVNFTAWGYLWHRTAQQSFGGPKRPGATFGASAGFAPGGGP